jgi:hypothetical protein
MFYIGCTRFNNSTYKENLDYRSKNDISVIYGSALKIRNIYLPDSLIFVVEMNNDTNKIEGIGLIRNSLVSNKHHKIYEHIEYNRYIYSGKYWIKRDQLDPDIIEICDTILFKGKSHLKCRSGITIITEKLFTHWNYELDILKDKIKYLFLKYFTPFNIEISQIVEIVLTNKEEERIENEEFIEIISKKRKRLVNYDKNIEK